MKPIRAALAGFNETGLALLNALRHTGDGSVVAIGDDRADVLRAAADEFAVPTFTDLRSLVVESMPKGLNLLLVAMEPYQTVDLMAAAADRGVPVLAKTPPARDGREASRLLADFDRADVSFAVVRGWMFEPAFTRLLEARQLAGHVYCADATVTVVDTPAGWRGDRIKSGGGALLYGAYDIIDLLVCTLGTPESVYAQCTTALPPGVPRTYDTEDAGVICLRYANAAAVVTARRGAAGAAWSVRMVGTDRMLQVSPKGLVVSPISGGKARHYRVKADTRYVPIMRALVAYLADEPGGFRSLLRDHVSTLATIDAAYLSARTGQPESVARVAEHAGT